MQSWGRGRVPEVEWNNTGMKWTYKKCIRKMGTFDTPRCQWRTRPCHHHIQLQPLMPQGAQQGVQMSDWEGIACQREFHPSAKWRLSFLVSTSFLVSATRQPGNFTYFRNWCIKTKTWRNFATACTTSCLYGTYIYYSISNSGFWALTCSDSIGFKVDICAIHPQRVIEIMRFQWPLPSRGPWGQRAKL